jgi:hypothetical protein
MFVGHGACPMLPVHTKGMCGRNPCDECHNDRSGKKPQQSRAVGHVAKGAMGFHLEASQWQVVSALRERDAIIIRAGPLNWQSSTTD